MLPLIIKNLELVKEKNPFVYNLSNLIAMNFVINGLLSLGASYRASSIEFEVEEIIKASSSVVLNTGMINHKNQGLYAKIADVANKLGKPLILDPSGADLTSHHRGLVHQLLISHKFDIVRGNTHEIMAISGESTFKAEDKKEKHAQAALLMGQALSHRHDMCVVVSGKEDVIIVKEHHRIFDYGHTLMPRISGIGCLLSSVLGAFHAVDKDPLSAASSGIVIYGMAGELAAKKSTIQGPGTFQSGFLDMLHNLSQKDLEEHYRHG